MGFFSNLVGFENLFSKNFTEDVIHNPTRLITGVDPASTKVWNTALGRDDLPLVNVYGSPGQQYYDQAKAQGIDTGAAEQFHALADKVANYYAMQGISGIGGGATGAGTDSGGSGMGIMDMFSGGDSGGSNWGNLIGGALGAAGSYMDSKKNAQAAAGGSSSTGTQDTTSSTVLSPAIAKLLGLGGDGILGGLTNSMGKQNLLSDVGKDFINGNAQNILYNGLGTTTGMIMNPYQNPYIQAAKIEAPNQNNVNLAPTFQSMLAGGDTSALTKSLQAGNDLTNAQFQQNTGDVTDNLMKTVLPSIRSNSVLTGQYGGSRQGVAEGNAISDYTKQLTNGATQVGLANSANTAGQLANNYEQGQNRALSAAQGLSAQQYSTAAADAAARQAGDNTNVNALLSTNALNSSNKIAATTLQQGLVGAANNYANADLGRLGMTATTLAPFLDAGSLATTNVKKTGADFQPVYANTASNTLGGALAGSQLANMFNSGSGSNSGFSATRNSDSGGLGSWLGNMFGGTSASAANMKGSTSSPFAGFTPSSGGGTDWGSLSDLFSGGY